MNYDEYLLAVKHLTDVEKAERILQGHCDACLGIPLAKVWCRKCNFVSYTPLDPMLDVDDE